MANDPQRFNYTDPPAGLKPTVNAEPPPTPTAPETPPGAKTVPPLSEEQKKRRLVLLDEMTQHVADVVPVSPGTENLEKPILESAAGDMAIYKTALIEALASPDMKSIRFLTIGSGQCGGRIAEQFYRFGYEAVAINTAQQDLAFLELPEERKLVLPYALGGAGKDLMIGQKAAAENMDKIVALLTKFASKVDQVMICTSGAGGSGAGSLVPLLQAISQVEAINGLPIVLVYTLPMNDEGAVAKSNAVKTLDRVARMANDNIISSIIIIDNAKIQELYPDVSIKDFWKLANFDIAHLFNMFNTVSKCATHYDALDPMDFANILSTGGCLIYGKAEIPVALDENGQCAVNEADLARALITSTTDGTLAEGFDLRQAVKAGVIITGSEAILSQIPAIAINYAFNELSNHIGNDCTLYKGIYTDETKTQSLSIITIFTGLGLPTERVLRLKLEAEAALQKIEGKQKTKLVLDKDETLAKSAPFDQIRQKNTPMGRMIDHSRRIR